MFPLANDPLVRRVHHSIAGATLRATAEEWEPVPDWRGFLADLAAEGLVGLREAFGKEEGKALIAQLHRADHRMSFLARVPTALAFGSRVGRELSRAIWGQELPGAADLTGLINGSIPLLDGLVDERPDLFAEARDDLVALISSCGLDLVDPVAGPPSRDPLISLTWRVVHAWVARVRAAPLKPGGARDRFVRAVRIALDQEVRVDRHAFGRPAALDVTAATLEGKSTWAVRATGLAVVVARDGCMEASVAGRGLVGDSPGAIANEVDLDRLEALLHAVGRYLGWIDDVDDLVADIDAGLWSNVTLLLAGRHDGRIGMNAEDMRHVLVREIASERAPILVKEEARSRIADVRRLIGEADIARDPIECLLRDATQAWLGWAA